MVVAVQRPREKEDTLTTIMKGLQVANSILGIKEKLTAPGPDELTQRDILGLEAKGMKAVEPGTEGAGKAVFTAPGGEKLSFVKPAPGLTPAEKMKFDIEEKKLAAMQAQNLLKNKQIAEDRKMREVNTAADAKSEFLQDKRVNKAIDSFETGQRVEEFLAQEAPVIDQIALRQIFRMSGDVGVIRAEDLEQLGSSPALVDRLKLLTARAATGQTIADDERADLKEAARVLQQYSKQQLRTRAGQMGDILAKRTAMTKDEAIEFFDPEGQLTTIRRPDKLPGPIKIPGEGQAIGAPQLTGDDAINQLLGE